MAVFKAFKPEAMNKIAQSMGYSGDMREFESFIEQDPARQARMKQFTNAAMEMAKGGVVKMQTGGTPTTTPPTTDQSIGATTIQRMYEPGVPVGGTTVAAATPSSTDQNIQQGTGTLTGGIAVPTAMAGGKIIKNANNRSSIDILDFVKTHGNLSVSDARKRSKK